MEDTRPSEVGLKFYLPMELWPEILSKLPVKSLLQFRCVSKSLLASIDDPDFARLHLKNFKNNRHNTHLLVVEGNQKECVIRCSDTFETKATALRRLGPIFNERSRQVECSIDGLVLLNRRSRDHSTFSKSNDLMVWNPSIRKSHEFPSFPKIGIFPFDGSFREAGIGLGLGYDPLAKDYKHVKLIIVEGDILHSVAVYTLGAVSWKRIGFQGKGCSSWRWEPKYKDMKAVYF